MTKCYSKMTEENYMWLMPSSKGFSPILIEMKKTKVRWSVLTTLAASTSLGWSFRGPENDQLG